MAIWYIWYFVANLVIFSRFGILYQENLATLLITYVPSTSQKHICATFDIEKKRNLGQRTFLSRLSEWGGGGVENFLYRLLKPKGSRT
jgi:hypothetical protein